MDPNLLILGGTTEATMLANALGARGIGGVFSYAGRVERPKRQPLATRIGGFGGAGGLVHYLREAKITHVVDATHPFAAQMSRNAFEACTAARIPLVALTRPVWKAEKGDNWRHVSEVAAAVTALQGPPRRVMLAIGRMHLGAFAAQPQHFYLLRLVDPPETALPLPDCHVEVSRGPFREPEDRALMLRHRIDLVVSKNAGGTAARAKIDAARRLGLSVVMIDRPELPPRHEVHGVDAILDWLDHAGTDLGV